MKITPNLIIGALCSIIMGFSGWWGALVYCQIQADHDKLTALLARDEIYRGKPQPAEEAKIKAVAEAAK